MIKKYTTERLREISQIARDSERQRTNLNIHESTDAEVQRLFLAFEPDTYIRPHRHPEPHKWELMILLEGELDVLLFDDAGEVTQCTRLSGKDTRVIEIPPNTWHSYVSRQPGTVVMEVKQGSYLPTSEQDFLATSPAENTEQAQAYFEWMKQVAQQAE
jgi:cupin fold WbuC family metalloprotein